MVHREENGGSLFSSIWNCEDELSPFASLSLEDLVTYAMALSAVKRGGRRKDLATLEVPISSSIPEKAKARAM